VRQGLDGVEEARRCLSCGVCNSCDRCVTYCPDGVLRRVEGELVFDYDYCKGCGVCVSECSRAVIYMKAG
jgi:Pyruvate/2-oxoacid:ferredoxin oxidoreductase delta subunit